MTVFDLLFVILFLATVVTLLIAAARAATGRAPAAGRILKRLGVSAVAYLAIVYAVALLSPGQRLALGENTCSDDWCIAVTDARPVATDPSTLDVTFRVSSRARRVSQRERFVLVYLRDDHGRRIDGDAGPADVPFDVRLEPSETVMTHRRFVLPAGSLPGAVVLTRGGFPFPGGLIIGEATSLIHPTSVRL